MSTWAERDAAYEAAACREAVYWWDGEYEGECELPRDHGGDHYDGVSWFNDEKLCTDDEHLLGPPSQEGAE